MQGVAVRSIAGLCAGCGRQIDVSRPFSTQVSVQHGVASPIDPKTKNGTTQDSKNCVIPSRKQQVQRLLEPISEDVEPGQQNHEECDGENRMLAGKSGPLLGVVVQVRNENQRPFRDEGHSRRGKDRW